MDELFGEIQVNIDVDELLKSDQSDSDSEEEPVSEITAMVEAEEEVKSVNMRVRKSRRLSKRTHVSYAEADDDMEDIVAEQLDRGKTRSKRQRKTPNTSDEDA